MKPRFAATSSYALVTAMLALGSATWLSVLMTNAPAPLASLAYELGWLVPSALLLRLGARRGSLGGRGCYAVVVAPAALELMLAGAWGRAPAFTHSALGWALRTATLAAALLLARRAARAASSTAQALGHTDAARGVAGAIGLGGEGR